MSTVWPYLAGILPTILVATLFYFLIKSMIEGDRRERIAQAKFEKEQDSRNRVVEDRPTPEAPAAPAPDETGRKSSPPD